MNASSKTALAICALLLWSVPAAQAQGVVVGNTILIGQSGEFSGQGVAKENTCRC